jgi:O-antigen/teichoic acid export membrane protein
MAFASATSYGKQFLLARFLPVEHFGKYSFIATLITYAVPLVTAGILDGYSRQYTLLIGAGESGRAQEIRNSSLAALLVCVPVILGLGVLLCAMSQWYPAGVGVGLTALAAVETSLLVAFYFGMRELRGQLKSLTYALMLAFRTCCDVVLISVLAPRYGLSGVLSAECVVLAVTASLILSRMGGFKLDFSRLPIVKGVVKEGLLIVVAGIVANTVGFGDRLVLGAALPDRSYSLYAYHCLLLSLGAVLTNIVFQYCSPRLIMEYGKSKDPKSLFLLAGKISAQVFFAALVVLPVIGFVFVRLSQRHFPNYTMDIRAVILLGLAAAIDIANLLPSALQAIGKLKTVIIIQAIGTLPLVGLGLVLWTNSWNMILSATLVLSARVVVALASVTSIVVLRNSSALQLGDDQVREPASEGLET